MAAVVAAAVVSGPAAGDPPVWRQINPNFTWGPERAVHDVEATGAGEAWLAGYQGALINSTPQTDTAGNPIPNSQIFTLNPKPVLQRWTGGTGWATQPTPGMTGEGEILSLDSGGPSDVWACGRTFQWGSSSSWAAHFDGQSWTSRSVGLSTGCEEVQVLGSDTVFRQNVRLMKLAAGAQWATALTSPPGWPDTLRGRMKIRSLTDIYAYTTGSSDRITHWDGSTWTEIAPPPVASKLVVSDTDIWAFPGSGPVLRLTGGVWEATTASSVQTIHSYEHDGSVYYVTSLCYCPMEGPRGPTTYPLYRWNGSAWTFVINLGQNPTFKERDWNLPGGGFLSTDVTVLGLTAKTDVPLP
ncbi:hypothetical protein GCM10010468_23090 [Actinocorallia longicatena]|uniref:Uncharacterized protein n=1 Tax=Actinocorallia longicatena TaxID=111803 RepID=A0ABP6Q6J9_9ACTN